MRTTALTRRTLAKKAASNVERVVIPVTNIEKGEYKKQMGKLRREFLEAYTTETEAEKLRILQEKQDRIERAKRRKAIRQEMMRLHMKNEEEEYQKYYVEKLVNKNKTYVKEVASKKASEKDKFLRSMRLMLAQKERVITRENLEERITIDSIFTHRYNVPGLSHIDPMTQTWWERTYDEYKNSYMLTDEIASKLIERDYKNTKDQFKNITESLPENKEYTEPEKHQFAHDTLKFLQTRQGDPRTELTRKVVFRIAEEYGLERILSRKLTPDVLAQLFENKVKMVQAVNEDKQEELDNLMKVEDKLLDETKPFAEDELEGVPEEVKEFLKDNPDIDQQFRTMRFLSKETDMALRLSEIGNMYKNPGTVTDYIKPYSGNDPITLDDFEKYGVSRDYFALVGITDETFNKLGMDRTQLELMVKQNNLVEGDKENWTTELLRASKDIESFTQFKEKCLGKLDKNEMQRLGMTDEALEFFKELKYEDCIKVENDQPRIHLSEMIINRLKDLNINLNEIWMKSRSSYPSGGVFSEDLVNVFKEQCMTYLENRYGRDAYEVMKRLNQLSSKDISDIFLLLGDPTSNDKMYKSSKKSLIDYAESLLGKPMFISEGDENFDIMKAQLNNGNSEKIATITKNPEGNFHIDYHSQVPGAPLDDKSEFSEHIGDQGKYAENQRYKEDKGYKEDQNQRGEHDVEDQDENSEENDDDFSDSEMQEVLDIYPKSGNEDESKDFHNDDSEGSTVSFKEFYDDDEVMENLKIKHLLLANKDKRRLGESDYNFPLRRYMNISFDYDPQRSKDIDEELKKRYYHRIPIGILENYAASRPDDKVAYENFMDSLCTTEKKDISEVIQKRITKMVENPDYQNFVPKDESGNPIDLSRDEDEDSAVSEESESSVNDEVLDMLQEHQSPRQLELHEFIESLAGFDKKRNVEEEVIKTLIGPVSGEKDVTNASRLAYVEVLCKTAMYLKMKENPDLQEQRLKLLEEMSIMNGKSSLEVDDQLGNQIQEEGLSDSVLRKMSMRVKTKAKDLDIEEIYQKMSNFTLDDLKVVESVIPGKVVNREKLLNETKQSFLQGLPDSPEKRKKYFDSFTSGHRDEELKRLFMKHNSMSSPPTKK